MLFLPVLFFPVKLLLTMKAGNSNNPYGTPNQFATPANEGQAGVMVVSSRNEETQTSPAPYTIEVGQVLFTDPYGHRRAIYEIESPGNYKTVTLDGQHLRTDTLVRKVGTRQGIGTYYREGDVISVEEVVHLVIRAQKATEERNENQRKEKEALEAERNTKIQTGKLLLPVLPEGMAAVIIAELDEDISDSQQDYHGHRTLQTVYLSWSKHTRDIFSEMRKAADTYEPTKHLGMGKSVFKTFQVNTNGYRCEWGQNQTTEEAAKAYIDQKNTDPQPEGFRWEYQESNIEHREKYSMGSGYYLKDGHSDSNGWKVSKANLHPSMLETLQLAAAEGRLLCLKSKPEKEVPAETQIPEGTTQEVQSTTSGEIQLIDYSEKSFAVIGDTKPIKDKIKALGGRFNKFLTCGPGWIFSKSKLDEVVAALKEKS